ncbi:MAG: hypothetical protein K6L73_04560 [Cellvibrionaceae bacterium]
MGICVTELRKLVVKPTLEFLDAYSEAAEDLIVGTAAQESELGFHLNIGPTDANQQDTGYGIYRITAEEHQHVWDTYLVNHPQLASDIRGLASQHEFLKKPHLELATNLSYATAIAWAIYQSNGASAPAHEDVTSMAQTWFDHFHHNPTINGSPETFAESYRRLVMPSKGELAA